MSGGSGTSDFGRCVGIHYKRIDLNHSNRRMRTRMSGGVGGVRSAMIGPYPDYCAATTFFAAATKSASTPSILSLRATMRPSRSSRLKTTLWL